MERLRLKELQLLKRAYKMQKKDAARRGVATLLTFMEWLTIWRESGHLHERGRKKGQYCMARYGDKGAYEVGNVRICTTEENNKERWANPEYRASMIAKASELHTGRIPSPETIEKLSKAQKRRLNDPEIREKYSVGQRRRQAREAEQRKLAQELGVT